MCGNLGLRLLFRYGEGLEPALREKELFSFLYYQCLPENIVHVINRDQLNTLTEDLIDRTIEVCVEVLDASGAQPEDVDSVILVGGQTRMPLVVDKVSMFFGKAPTKGVHPDEVVACGAALMAHSLGTESSVRLIDVLPMSIGGRQPDGKFKTLFEANTSLPSSTEVGVATTHADQTAIEIFLYQGAIKILHVGVGIVFFKIGFVSDWNSNGHCSIKLQMVSMVFSHLP